MSDPHQAAKEIFSAAVQLEPERRRRFVAERCAADPALEREVLDLLRFHRDDPTLTLEPRADTGAGADTPSPPRSIGHFRVLRKLGEGGMGEVYEAEQDRPVRRRVAIKLVKPGMDTAQVLARFETERQALALMNHPSIAHVYEAGATAAGRPYFAMELVAGEAITGYCDRYRLSVRERLELFVQVCAGVAHAHHKGVIHRDLKPSNVLVTLEDGEPVPKIIDFGIAKAIDRRLGERSVHTELGGWLGTLDYMSPEQAEPSGLDVDTRSDVYSLGVLLYELLVGVRPFDDEARPACGLDEMRRRVREDEPTRPSLELESLGTALAAVARDRQTVPAALARALRGDLDWIVLRALEKDRVRRYGSPSELAADIRRHLTDEPVLAGPPTFSYRLGKLVRRHRFGFLSAALVLVALVLGIVGTGIGMLQARRHAAASEQVSRVLQELFAEVNPFSSRTIASTATLLDQAVERVERDLRTQPAVKARLLRTLGAAYRDLSIYDRAGTLLERALAEQRDALGDDHLEVAQTMIELGWLRLKNGAYADAREPIERAWTIRRAALGEEHPLVAEAEEHLGFLLWQEGRYAEAEPWLLRALATRERVLGSGSLEVSRTLFTLQFLWMFQGRYAASREAGERALEIRRRLLGEEHLRVGWSLRNLALLSHLAGDDERAFEDAERAHEIMESAIGPRHSDLAFSLDLLGFTHRRRGEDEAARVAFARGLDIRLRALGPDHPDLAYSLTGLGWIDLNAGDLDAAARRFERAYELRRASHARDHPEIGWSLHDLASHRQRAGRHAEARELSERSLAILEGALGRDHPQLFHPLRLAATLCREAGDDDGAIELDRRVEAIETALEALRGER